MTGYAWTSRVAHRPVSPHRFVRAFPTHSRVPTACCRCATMAIAVLVLARDDASRRRHRRAEARAAATAEDADGRAPSASPPSSRRAYNQAFAPVAQIQRGPVARHRPRATAAGHSAGGGSARRDVRCAGDPHDQCPAAAGAARARIGHSLRTLRRAIGRALSHRRRACATSSSRRARCTQRWCRDSRSWRASTSPKSVCRRTDGSRSSSATRASTCACRRLPTGPGERVVLRLLDKDSARLDLTALGMSDATLAAIDRLIREPHGIVLVTGPTGSGKTTTLYAAMSRLPRGELNVMTVEDPIEFALDGVGQTQVNPRIEFTFARALRSILRQDPDIIMIGEIRDLETAQIAVQASLTGHLVLATLHTNDAVSAVTRLADMGVEPYLLASSVLGVLAQRLVRCLCPACRLAAVPTEGEAKVLAEHRPAGSASTVSSGGLQRVQRFRIPRPNRYLRIGSDRRKPAPAYPRSRRRTCAARGSRTRECGEPAQGRGALARGWYDLTGGTAPRRGSELNDHGRRSPSRRTHRQADSASGTVEYPAWTSWLNRRNHICSNNFARRPNRYRRNASRSRNFRAR